MAVVLVSLRKTNVGGDEKRESTVLDASVAEHAHAATAVSALSRTHAHTHTAAKVVQVQVVAVAGRQGAVRERGCTERRRPWVTRRGD